MDFGGKVVLITGGAGVIGKALARTFLEKGAKVSICDINEVGGKVALEELQKDFGKKNVMFSKCDVSKEEDFENAYNSCENFLGVIDILINNAAVLVNDYRKVAEVIQFGTIIGTELARKRMGKHNGGKGGFVVNIASICGVVPEPTLVFYDTAKAAVVHYSRVVGSEFHQNYSGVSVVCLCPGAVDTPFADLKIVIKGAYNKYSEEFLALIFNGGVKKLEPSEIGDSVIKLINDNKPGGVAIVDKDGGFFYVPPSFDTNFAIQKIK